MDSMNNDFYKRMIRSTKRLHHHPEPQSEQLVSDSSFDSRTPRHSNNPGKAYKRNSSTLSDLKSKKSVSRITKPYRNVAINMNDLMYNSFDNCK